MQENAETEMQWGQGTWGTSCGEGTCACCWEGCQETGIEVRGGCGLLCMPAGYFTLDWVCVVGEPSTPWYGDLGSGGAEGPWSGAARTGGGFGFQICTLK